MLLHQPVSGGLFKSTAFPVYSFHIDLRIAQAIWFGAEKICANAGMKLMALETEAESNWLINILLQYPSKSSLEWWTSGCDLYTPGHPIWLSTGYEVTANPLYKSVARNECDRKECIKFSYWTAMKSPLVLERERCDRMKMFVCEQFLDDFPLE